MKQMSSEGEINKSRTKYWLLLGCFGSWSNILENALHLCFLLWRYKQQNSIPRMLLMKYRENPVLLKSELVKYDSWEVVHTQGKSAYRQWSLT
jgi:hypothetical protein